MSDLISYGALAPPTVLILVCAATAWLTLWHRRLGVGLTIIATSLLFVASLPVVAARMLQEVEIAPPPTTDYATAQAIVILGSGVHKGDGDKVPDTLSARSLERVAFGAHAYRKLGLRVAVTGGRSNSAHTSEASLMKQALEADYNVPVAWAEDASLSTYENARFTARLLAAEQVRTVVVVTHAWHMKRALWSFERAGLHAIPWAGPPTIAESDRIADYLPSLGALEDSYYALHEAIGLIYYRRRYGGP